MQLFEAFSKADSAWDACRNALRQWYELELEEGPELAERWFELLGVDDDAVRELLRFAAMLDQTPAAAMALELAPFVRELPDEDAVAVFRDIDDGSMLFGFDREGGEFGPTMWSFDYDRVPDDLNPDDPEDSLDEPDRDVSAANPAEFAIAMLVHAFSPANALMLTGDNPDRDEMHALLQDAVGPGVHFAGVDVYGADGLFVTQRWAHPFDYRVDIIGLDRGSCEPLTDAIFAQLGFSRRVLDHHDWG